MGLKRSDLEGAILRLMNRTGYLPRFHPLICEHKGVTAWWVCDGHADTESTHSQPSPYMDEPCVDHDEALELSDLLNEEEEDAAS
jgi:hypothetical protein